MPTKPTDSAAIEKSEITDSIRRLKRALTGSAFVCQASGQKLKATKTDMARARRMRTVEKLEARLGRCVLGNT